VAVRPGLQGKHSHTGDPEIADIKWQEFFIGEQLQKLIDLALKNNRDLRIAALNIERSQALYRIQRADLFPTVNASGSALEAETPGYSPLQGAP